MESEAIAVVPVETPASAISIEPKTEPAATPPPVAPPLVARDEAALRTQWADRIRAETRLPGGLRQQLATVVEEAATGLADGEEPRLTVSQVANLFAAALPSFLTAPPRIVEHPQGERFFHGVDVTSEEAANLAREQLQRTGFHRES